MIWKNGLTWAGEKALKSRWHIWFAWYPVVVGITEDNHYIKAWLQNIERKGEWYASWGDCGWNWEYRTICWRPPENDQGEGDER